MSSLFTACTRALRPVARPLALLVSLWAVLVAGVVFVSAQTNGRLDGRININPLNLGGSSVYCVDQFFRPSDWYATGGIRVLGPTGQEQLFVTDDVIDQVDIPAVITLLGTGANEYGPLELYRHPNRDFRLTGFDEFGKPWEMIWQGCRLAEGVTSITAPGPLVTPVVTPVVTAVVTPETTPVVTPVVTPETTPVVTPETTPVVTPVVTPETTPVVTPVTTPDQFCTLNPDSTLCRECTDSNLDEICDDAQFCLLNPDSTTCRECTDSNLDEICDDAQDFCFVNPTSIDCIVIPPCLLNPTLPGCEADPCLDNPEAIECGCTDANEDQICDSEQDTCTVDPLAIGCPQYIFCQQNPNFAGCPGYDPCLMVPEMCTPF
jgi:hypothetical protein